MTALSASVGASLLNGVLLERGTPSVVGGTVGLVGGWALVQAIRGDDAAPSASATAQSPKEWSVAPAAVSTGRGSRPGVQAAIRF